MNPIHHRNTPQPEPLEMTPYHITIVGQCGTMLARCFPTITGTRAELLERAALLAKTYSAEVVEHGIYR